MGGVNAAAAATAVHSCCLVGAIIVTTIGVGSCIMRWQLIGVTGKVAAMYSIVTIGVRAGVTAGRVRAVRSCRIGSAGFRAVSCRMTGGTIADCSSLCSIADSGLHHWLEWRSWVGS